MLFSTCSLNSVQGEFRSPAGAGAATNWAPWGGCRGRAGTGHARRAFSVFPGRLHAVQVRPSSLRPLPPRGGVGGRYGGKEWFQTEWTDNCHAEAHAPARLPSMATGLSSRTLRRAWHVAVRQRCPGGRELWGAGGGAGRARGWRWPPATRRSSAAWPWSSCPSTWCGAPASARLLTASPGA